MSLYAPVAPYLHVHHAVRDVGHHLELVRVDPAVGDLDAQHLVVAALALAVDALVEAEDAEGLVVDLTREIPLHAVLEAVELVGHDRVERGGPEFGDVDHRKHLGTALAQGRPPGRGTAPRRNREPEAGR